jgi:hypothetical protein
MYGGEELFLQGISGETGGKEDTKKLMSLVGNNINM